MAGHVVYISLEDQRLRLCSPGRGPREYPVSTARVGAGQQSGSLATPLGWHIVRAKIGAGQPAGAVFVGRRPTGEVLDETLLARYPERDWILSRILWLSGLERGINRLGDVDTMQRYIYIHGTPDSEPMGTPASHGCIRMTNEHVIELYAALPVGTRVLITPAGLPA